MELIERAEELIKTATWRFAKTYANTWPHEYIVAEEQPEAFKVLSQAVAQLGTEGRFFKQPRIYWIHKNYKYWQIQNILNREPLKGYTPEEKMRYLQNPYKKGDL